MTLPFNAEAGDWLDVSDAYDILNEFRMDPENQWYYSQSGSKVTLSNMYELERDETYEALAEARAKERWTAYYTEEIEWDPVNPHLGANIAYKNTKWKAENLGFHEDYTARDMIFGKFHAIYGGTYEGGWAESTYSYSGQGHRRIMLTKKATKVGIACFQVRNAMDTAYTQCWVMVVGN